MRYFVRLALLIIGTLSGLAAQSTLTWTTAPQLPNALRGTAYSAQFATTGGTAPVSYAIITGALPTGLALSTAGRISGSPIVSGGFTFTVRAVDSCAGAGCPKTADRAFTLIVGTTALFLTTTTLPAASICAPYSVTLEASGGTIPYTWSATGLPTGFSLNSSTGVLSGSSTTAGSYNVTITVADSRNLSTSRPMTLAVSGGSGSLQITTSTLPSGTVGTAYSTVLAASGGTVPYVFSIVEQPVPGLSLVPSGSIQGTPSTAGAYATLYRVSDGGGCAATRRISTQVNAAAPPAAIPPVITTPVLAAARAGVLYETRLAASGGTAPYTWSLAAGTLPEGMELTSEGVITGTPALAGLFPLLIRVTDAAQASSTRNYNLPVNPPIQITTTFLPAGKVGTPYSQKLEATGGIGALVWTRVGGTAPPGVDVDLFGGAVVGTPQQHGEFAFDVMVRDSLNATATVSLTLSIAEALGLPAFTLPNAQAGQPYTATIMATGGTPPVEFTASDLPQGLMMDLAGTISGTAPDAGAHVVNIQVKDSSGATVSRRVALVIDPFFRIRTEFLASGQAGTPYEEKLTATDGKPPYVWSAPVPRSLPLGVTVGAADGQIRGTPIEPGEYSVSFRVVDSTGAQAEKVLLISIRHGFRITPDRLAPANVNVPYSAVLQTLGARTPVIWALESGALPPGVVLDPVAGAITGRPARAGEFTFTVKAVDATQTEASLKLVLTVRDAMRLAPGVLNSAGAGVPYRQTIEALDGQGTMTWTLLNGLVPDGLRLEFSATSATITGTPTKPGAFEFTLQARDGAGQTATQTYTLRIVGPLSVLTESLRLAVVGANYSVVLAADGGEAPYAWSLASGTLPGGLRLETESGAITGSPTQAGTFGFTVEVRDKEQRRATRNLSIRVARDLTPNLESLAAATVGIRYSQQLRTLVDDTTWSISQGRLPDGLSLSAASGDIAGVPSQAGTFSFTVAVRDSGGASGSREYTIQVARLEIPRLAIDTASTAAARQAPVTLTLNGPAPVDLEGILSLRFQSEAGMEDPAMRLSSPDGRAARFTITQGATRAVFAGGGLLLQTGTVAGSITLVASINANGVGVTPDPAPARTIRIPRAAPLLTMLTARRAAASVNVDLTGYATSREITSAEFRFLNSAGAALHTFTVALSAIMNDWYGSRESLAYGGLFQFTLPFVVSGQSTSVTVTLTNPSGKSEPRTVQIR